MPLLSAAPAWLARAGQAFLDLLYPPHCVGCGRAGALFCDVCQAQVTPVEHPLCRRCGRPGAAGLCASCRRTPSPLDGVTATAVFAPPLRNAIHHFKYRNRPALVAPLAARLAETWTAAGLAADLIVPVPLHPQRERERGYNQSALLAQRLSDAVGVPAALDLLMRRRATPPQTHLGRRERKENVAGAFACRRNLSGAAIVLIDDVCTTGSTLEACAAALVGAGAGSVWGLTVARARWDTQAGGSDLSQ